MVNWRLVSAVPLFAKLDAPQIADIVALLTPLLVPPKYAVVRLGDAADTMYFIISGRVEVEIHPNPIELGAGEYFGEIGIIEKRQRTTAVISLTECQLLELNADNFWDLLEKYPAIHDELRQTMADRLAELEQTEIGLRFDQPASSRSRAAAASSNTSPQAPRAGWRKRRMNGCQGLSAPLACQRHSGTWLSRVQVAIPSAPES